MEKNVHARTYTCDRHVSFFYWKVCEENIRKDGIGQGWYGSEEGRKGWVGGWRWMSWVNAWGTRSRSHRRSRHHPSRSYDGIAEARNRADKKKEITLLFLPCPAVFSPSDTGCAHSPPYRLSFDPLATRSIRPFNPTIAHPRY